MIYSVLFINISFNFAISFWTFSTFSLLGLIIFYLKNPEKFEKLIALIHKGLKFLWHRFDYSYIKYDLQGKINDYISIVSKKVKHLNVRKVNIKWIKPGEKDEKSYIQNDQLILRMRKSENQNENIVNASMIFISHSFIKKAKSYIAKYQKESLDLYACYDLLKQEKTEILDQFVQDFLKSGLDNKKASEFFEKYSDIDKAGIFYPLLIQELTFLGEKVFAKNNDAAKIYDEVKSLVFYLCNYANRKLEEKIISDFNGTYCKFAIRIIGKSFKISNLGEETYIKNLNKVDKRNETLYLIGNHEYKTFMKSVYDKCKNQIGHELLYDETYKAIIKDRYGNDKRVKNYMMILRNTHIQVYHKN